MSWHQASATLYRDETLLALEIPPQEKYKPITLNRYMTHKRNNPMFKKISIVARRLEPILGVIHKLCLIVPYVGVAALFIASQTDWRWI
jgi:hypothetical protein